MASGPERVVLVNQNFDLTGSLGRITVLLARELVRLGLDVHCYCNPDTRTAEAAGVTFHDVRPVARGSSRIGRPVQCGSFALAATRALRRDRARFAYDIVDVSGIAAWEHDVVDVHEVAAATRLRWPEEEGRAFRAARLRAALVPALRPQVGLEMAVQRLQLRPGAYRRIIATSGQVRDDLARLYGVAESTVDVLTPPIELDAFAPGRNGDAASVRAELGLGPEERMLLFVGNAFARKGLDHALDALAGLDPTVHLVVVGTGDRAQYAERARAAGVGGRVHLVGPVDAPARFYRAADVFVLPTHHDVWGMTIVEAMAAGVPVVTTRAAGGAAEVERAGAGLVLDAPDAGELREAVASLLARPELRAAMAAHGPGAVKRWGVPAHAAARLETYERALAAPRARPRRRVASLPPAGSMNPYQRLLYHHLEAEGFPLAPETRLSIGSLIRNRRSVAILHVHWPESYYTFGRGPERLREPLSWAKLGLLGIRLGTARLLGYRLVWTVHQVYPHERLSPTRDRLASRLLADASDVLIAHDAATADRIRDQLGCPTSRVVQIPHGSYVGVYPPGRPRAAVRAELGLGEDTFAFVAFGELRAHKSFTLLVRAFRDVKLAGAALVIAGYADPERAADVRRAAGDDPRIHLLLGYVPDERVAELFGACDAAVASRDDGGTSGSLVLPLSLGLPVVVADRPTYVQITGGEEAGWLYRAGNASSLRRALERAAADPEDAARRGRAGLERARALDWNEIAVRTARAFEEVLR